MFKISDVVTYAASGVCRIAGETENKVKGEVRRYLVLNPVYDKGSTIYVPMANQELLGRIKHILSKDDIDSLILSMPDINTSWIENDAQRSEYFNKIVKSGNREELLKMVRMLYLHRKDQIEHGRKFHSSDERYLKEAEHVLFDEFAVVLGIKPEEVVDFITKRLENV